MTDNQNPQTDEQIENTVEIENSSTNHEENNTEFNQEKPEKTEREMLIEQLQVEKKNVEEIAKKAQHDYIMLKYEFEGLINRTKNQEQDLKNSTLKDILKKFLPIVEQLIQSVTHIPDELLDNPRTQGIKIAHDNALKILNGLGVSVIESIGLEPNVDYHEPLGVEETQDETMKGKIIKEYEKGFLLTQGDNKIVIKTAKVVVGG